MTQADVEILKYRLQQSMLMGLRAKMDIIPRDMVTQLGEEEGLPLIAQVTLTWDDFVQLLIKAEVI